jgi:hypothetical protein
MISTEVCNDWLACKVAELKEMTRSSSHTLHQSDDVTHARLRNVTALRQQLANNAWRSVELLSFPRCRLLKCRCFRFEYVTSSYEFPVLQIYSGPFNSNRCSP